MAESLCPANKQTDTGDCVGRLRALICAAPTLTEDGQTVREFSSPAFPGCRLTLSAAAGRVTVAFFRPSPMDPVSMEERFSFILTPAGGALYPCSYTVTCLGIRRSMDWNGQLEAATLGTARRLSATDTNVTDATVREILERHACNAAKAALAMLDAILQAEKQDFTAAAFGFSYR